MKIVLFDLDGTIADTIPMCIAAFRKAVEPYVVRQLSQEEIVQTFGLNEEGMIRQGGRIVLARGLTRFLCSLFRHACFVS